MIDVKGLADIRRESHGEFLLALATAAAVPGVGVEEGILLAIALSLIRHVRHSYRPHSTIITEDAEGHWVVDAGASGRGERAGPHHLPLRRGYLLRQRRSLRRRGARPGRRARRPGQMVHRRRKRGDRHRLFGRKNPSRPLQRVQGEERERRLRPRATPGCARTSSATASPRSSARAASWPRCTARWRLPTAAKRGCARSPGERVVGGATGRSSRAVSDGGPADQNRHPILSAAWASHWA